MIHTGYQGLISVHHILYVDDEPGLLEIAKLYLEKDGRFSVDIQSSASDCLPLLSSIKYDAIVSDYEMPGMNGIDLLKQIRSSGNPVPFILFTGRGREAVVIQALNEGADFYIQKGGEPVSQFAELASKIHHAVTRKRAQDVLRERETQLRATLESTADGILAVDNNGKILQASRRFAEIWKIPPAIMECGDDRAVLDFVRDQLVYPVVFLKKVESLPLSDVAENDILTLRDGRVIERYSFPMIMDGAPLGRVWSFRDITTRRRTEEALAKKHEELMASYEQLTAVEEELKGQFDQLAESQRIIQSSEERLIMAQEIGRTGCWEYSIATNKIWASAEGPRIFGYPAVAGDFPIVDIESCMEEPVRVRQALSDLIHRGKEYNIEYTINPADGSAPKVIHSVARLEKDAQGKPVRVVGIIQDITERKRAEETLLRSEEKFRSLVEYALEESFILDLTGTVLFANNAAARLVEIDDPARLVGRNVMEFIAPESQEDVIRDFARVSRGHDAFLAHYHVISTTGKKMYVESIGKIVNYEGKPASLISLRNITGQKRIEEALRESEERYLSLFNRSLDCIYIHDLAGNFIDANPAALALLGYAREDIPCLTFTSLLDGDQLRKAQDTVRTVVACGSHPDLVEYRLQKRTGEFVDIETKGTLILHDGKPFAILGIGRDITGRKRAEKAIRESEERYRLLTENVRDVIWQMDAEMTFSYVSPSAFDLCGYYPEEIIGKRLFDFISPESGKNIECQLVKLRKQDPGSRGSANYLIDMVHRDGTIIPTEVVTNPICDAGGCFIGWRGITRDITGRRRAEKALKDSEEKFRGIFDLVTDGIHIHEIEPGGKPGKFIEINESACRTLQYTRDEMLGHGPLDYVTGYHSRPLDEIFRELSTGGRSIFETGQRRKDGSILPVEINSGVVTLQGKRVVASVVRDITDRKRTEEALRLANRKLNLLSGITRHDINNQLTILQGYLSILEDKPHDPSLNAYFRTVAASAQRISAMIRFTKEYEAIGVNEPVWQYCSHLADAAAKDAPLGKVVVENTIPDGAQVFADPLIVKVFYNLVDNAVRYGGKITTVRFSLVDAGGDHLFVCEDDGEGIPADKKEMIFERGFGKNTGLGLFLCREILSITGITITETGEPGNGARFEIAVPAGAYRRNSPDAGHTPGS